MNTLRKSLSFFCLFVDLIKHSLRARPTVRVLERGYSMNRHDAMWDDRTIGRSDFLFFFFLMLPWSLSALKGFRHARFTTTISVKSGEKVRSFQSQLNCHFLFLLSEPGPPSQVNVYAFAKYIMVTWKAPVKPNGVITKYRVRSAQYEGSQPSDDLQVSWQEVGPGVFRKLLDYQTPERNYVVEIQAETSKGWGDKVRKTTRTVAYARK